MTADPARVRLAQIVAALSVTYTDAGVAVWLRSRRSGGMFASPLELIEQHDAIEQVADMVRRIGDADPSDFVVSDLTEVESA